MRNTLRYLVVLVSSEVNNLLYAKIVSKVNKLIDVVFSRNWARIVFGKGKL